MNRNTRVDTTLSAIITEAGAFPPEATTPNKDEQRQAVYPLRVYEGFNYLPTYYGYKSYFGLDSTLDASGLPADVVVEDIFVYQTRAFKNILIALTDRGIYVRQNTDWAHLLVLDVPPTNQSRFWTKACINQVFFFYYQQSDKVFVLEELIGGAGINMDVFNGMKVTPEREDTLSLDIQLFAFVPTLLNMEGQVGIYKAGGSLGFWDTDDSISWSAISDYTDFTPDLTTLANTIKLQDQVGKVTSIKEHGDGFIVYCTRSVVYVQEDNTALLRFKSTVVLGNVGVAYPREIAVSQPDTTHYAWTSMGLIQIEDGEATPIVPDFSDHVKRTKTPQYLEMLNNRYLCVGVMDPNFIPGNVDFSAVTVDPDDITMGGGGSPAVTIPGSTIPGSTVCLTIPEVSYEPDWDDPLVNPDPNNPNDPDYPTERIADSGTKPYYAFSILGQWQHRGASVTEGVHKVGEIELPIWRINEGAVDARYENVPGKLSGDEVAGVAQAQLDGMAERQIKAYESAYSISPERLEQRLQELRDKMEELEDADTEQPPYDVPLAIYGPFGGPDYLVALAENHPVAEQLGELDEDWEPPAARRTLIDDVYGIGPSTFTGYAAIQAAPGGLEAAKIGPLSAELYQLAETVSSQLGPYEKNRQDRDNWQYNLYVVTGGVSGRIYGSVPLRVTPTNPNREPYDTTKGKGYAVDMGSRTAVERGVYILEAGDKDSTIAREAFRERITGLLLDAYEGYRSEVLTANRAAWEQEITEMPTTITDPYTINGPVSFEFRGPLGEEAPVASITVWASHEVWGTYVTSSISYSLQPSQEAYDKLFGKIPATLPATAVGATALRQMEEEDKRGLIAVHQHYYSQNRSREKLDPSFLVKAAGRVDVPLGTPLGAPIADAYPSRFTEKAKWANRWYSLKYEPVLPEGGWPEGSQWPPAETDPNWDVTKPFPPTDTRGWETVQQSVICGTTEDVKIPGVYIPPVAWEEWTVENPPLTWQMQNGSIAPYNPTLFGAYVYDLHLQKWGVFKGNHKHLVDYQPINNYTPGSVPYKNFLIEGGCLTEDLEVALFNDYPTDNYIKYGKYQHVTSEFCAIEEVHVTFRGKSTGLIAVQFSLDGRSPEYGHSVGGWYNEALSHTLNCDIVGKWATITLSGHYDLSGMTVKSHPTGRR